MIYETCSYTRLIIAGCPNKIKVFCWISIERADSLQIAITHTKERDSPVGIYGRYCCETDVYSTLK